MSRLPKILVSSISCWNSRIGSNTLASWLTDYDSDKLANIYIREEVPDSGVCGRYFKISENNVMKSVFFRNLSTGKEYLADNKGPDTEDIKNINIQESRYSFFKKYRLWLFLYLREMLWMLGNWKSQELKEFVDSFGPEIIIVPLEGYIHFNRINQFIIKRTGAKAIGVFWDDNFTYKPYKWSIGFRVHRFFLRRNLKKTVSLCSGFFAISPQMKAECDKMFNVNSTVLTKPVFPCAEQSNRNESAQPLNMIYTGNLLIGRDKTLEVLLKAMQEINLDSIKITLDIYTTTNLNTKLIKTISKTPGCALKEPVPQGEALEKQKQADVLVFMEALSGKEKYSARLSFSTKLTDYFETGKCIFAIGPSDIAPIKYLSDEDAAVISTNADEIKQNLLEIINTDKAVEFGEKAYECGIRNHSAENVKAVFLKTVEDIYNGVTDNIC